MLPRRGRQRRRRRRTTRRRAALPGPANWRRAAFAPTVRNSRKRARLPRRGSVRPLSQPKMEPGLTPTSLANCSRVMRRRSRTPRMPWGETWRPRPAAEALQEFGVALGLAAHFRDLLLQLAQALLRLLRILLGLPADFRA